MSTRFEWVDLEHPFFGFEVVEGGASVTGCELGEWVCLACRDDTDDPEFETSECLEREDGTHDWHVAHPDECDCDPDLIVPEGKVGIVLSYDEVVVLVGEPAALRSQLLRMHNALPPAPENVGGGAGGPESRPGRWPGDLTR